MLCAAVHPQKSPTVPILTNIFERRFHSEIYTRVTTCLFKLAAFGIGKLKHLSKSLDLWTCDATVSADSSCDRHLTQYHFISILSMLYLLFKSSPLILFWKYSLATSTCYSSFAILMHKGSTVAEQLRHLAAYPASLNSHRGWLQSNQP